MLHPDATQLTTLVPATGSLLGALPLAPGVVRSGLQLVAGHVLVQRSAPASNTGALGTGWTLASVTQRPTLMRGGWGAAC